MAELGGTVRWVEYPPDLFGNLELDNPFYFELNGSMSKEQIGSFKQALTAPLASIPDLDENATDEQRKARDEAVRKATVAQQTSALTPYVRFGKEPLTISGRAITTLEEYFDFVTGHFLSLGVIFELSQALIQSNTLSAQSVFTSGRRSGGSGSTTRRSGGKAGSQTAAR